VELTETVYGKHTLQFCYDALGRRINKKVLKIEPTRVRVVVEETEAETNTTDAKTKKPKNQKTKKPKNQKQNTSPKTPCSTNTANATSGRVKT